MFCWKHYKTGVSAPPKKKKTQKKQKPSVKNWSKIALKTGPSMLRNKIGPVFNARNGSFFWSLVSIFFLKYPLLSEGRTRSSKQKTKQMDQFLTLKKANIGPVFNSTAYIYIYRYLPLKTKKKSSSLTKPFELLFGLAQPVLKRGWTSRGVLGRRSDETMNSERWSN